jgi:TetR/AcrR family transcriptional regulator, transcriptional repressor for nem operon
MHVFWRRGYSATSIDDLVREVGVNRASLYKTFGDKHALFVTALEHYSAKHLNALKEMLHAPPRATNGLRNVVDAFARISSDKGGTIGCLLGAATLELLPHDRQVTRIVSRCFAARRREFTRALTRARDQGDLADAVDISATAAYLVTYLQGMRMMGKTHQSYADAKRISRVAYSALGLIERRAS